MQRRFRTCLIAGHAAVLDAGSITINRRTFQIPFFHKFSCYCPASRFLKWLLRIWSTRHEIGICILGKSPVRPWKHEQEVDCDLGVSSADNLEAKSTKDYGRKKRKDKKEKGQLKPPKRREKSHQKSSKKAKTRKGDKSSQKRTCKFADVNKYPNWERRCTVHGPVRQRAHASGVRPRGAQRGWKMGCGYR
ncbi:hypothetical protein DFH06DRAFT_1447477 [Mycena polygramma]|nr:hypothetical protein DFH06DRAFT_1447477 [Mycena polygramma]